MGESYIYISLPDTGGTDSPRNSVTTIICFLCLQIFRVRKGATTVSMFVSGGSNVNISNCDKLGRLDGGETRGRMKAKETTDLLISYCLLLLPGSTVRLLHEATHSTYVRSGIGFGFFLCLFSS